MQSIDEADLPDRLLDGDEQVLEDILRLYGGPVLGLLRRRYSGVLSIEDLEDVFSTALFRVWKARARFDESRASLKVWLYRVAENTARDMLRLGWHKSRSMEVRQHEETLQERLPAEAAETRSGRDAEPPAAGQPTPIHMDLREIISELPETQRRIILADASARDDVACSKWLASELGTSPGNVRVYRKRAMDRIRIELGRRGHQSH